ncbi:MAG: hypothetical protein K2W96_19430, partial [Gemmataceae bacterium]|nr:hypothetical protein [Gemmataceae bacterium]
DGTVVGNVVNAGATVIVGSNSAHRTLNITGSYEQQVGGRLRVIGKGRGQFGLLHATTTADVRGIIELVLEGGFVPVQGAEQEFFLFGNTSLLIAAAIEAPPGWNVVTTATTAKFTY